MLCPARWRLLLDGEEYLAAMSASLAAWPLARWTLVDGREGAHCMRGLTGASRARMRSKLRKAVTMDSTAKSCHATSS